LLEINSHLHYLHRQESFTFEYQQLMQTTTFTYTIDQLDSVAQQFWQIAAPHHVIAFSGDMGAGKTTFISALCHYLQVADAVSSPTFALINEYECRIDGKTQTILHMDWYRLNNAEEAVNAGMEDCIDQARRGQVYAFVEWPEKAPELLRLPHLSVQITTMGAEERQMVIEVVN
jgi:tRNA threonylcarbamoyladenosine biosynthesis protein TsaE